MSNKHVLNMRGEVNAWQLLLVVAVRLVGLFFLFLLGVAVVHIAPVFSLSQLLLEYPLLSVSRKPLDVLHTSTSDQHVYNWMSILVVLSFGCDNKWRSLL